MQYKVSEIYHTRQGEGFWVGRKVVLVRFAGCNLHCPWCDTDYEKFAEIAVEELFNEILQTADDCKSVLVTGGEPLLQNLNPILERLAHNGFWIGLETNGTISDGMARSWCDHVTVSFKHFEDYKKLPGAFPHEIRIVNDGTWSVDQLCLLPGKFLECRHWYLSPMHTPKPDALKYVAGKLLEFNLAETIKLLAAVNQRGGGGVPWRLSLQTHKLIGLR